MNIKKNSKVVLILGANSDVAKAAIVQYVALGYEIIAASRDLKSLEDFRLCQVGKPSQLQLLYFDAVDYASHQRFYDNLPKKPHIVVYAAGFLVQNAEAFQDFSRFQQMASVNYMGAVSILSIISQDSDNKNLERIIGLSSLSGVRGRKSNFVYGSTKAAFTQFLAGLRQQLSSRKIVVNALVIGYINTKINKGLELNKTLIMEPDYVAKYIVNPGSSFVIVPNWKWKIIYLIVKLSPEVFVSKLP